MEVPGDEGCSRARKDSECVLPENTRPESAERLWEPFPTPHPFSIPSHSPTEF